LTLRSAGATASAKAGRARGYLPIEGHRAIAAAHLGGVESLSGRVDEVGDVREGRFPDIATESFHMAGDDELRRLYMAAAPVEAEKDGE